MSITVNRQYNGFSTRLRAHGHDFGRILFFWLHYLQCFMNTFFSDQMKFESHLQSYKHDTELTIPCNVNEACALLLFTKVQYTRKKIFFKLWLPIKNSLKHDCKHKDRKKMTNIVTMPLYYIDAVYFTSHVLLVTKKTS